MDKIDEKPFIQYYASQFYFGNLDWPFNNKFWKPKNGKWRWILEDCDASFDIYKKLILVQKRKSDFFNEDIDFENPFDIHLSQTDSIMNHPEGYRLFKYLFKYNEFRINFSNSFLVLTYTHFIPEQTTKILDSIENKLEPNMAKHYKKWMNDIPTKIGGKMWK